MGARSQLAGVRGLGSIAGGSVRGRSPSRTKDGDEVGKFVYVVGWRS
jgi:hypothetical protein